MSATSDEDSGPGVNRHRDPVAWERLRTHSKRLEEIGGGMKDMRDDISETKRAQAVQGTTIEALVGFQKDIKGDIRKGLYGLAGIFVAVLSFLGVHIWQIVHQPVPRQEAVTFERRP